MLDNNSVFFKYHMDIIVHASEINEYYYYYYYYYNNDEDAKLFDTYSCMLVNTTFVHSLNGLYGMIYLHIFECIGPIIRAYLH